MQQPVQRAAFSVSAGRFAGDVDAHDPHHEESFEEFTARYAVPVMLLWGGKGEVGGYNSWRRDGRMMQARKRRILAQWLHWAHA